MSKVAVTKSKLDDLALHIAAKSGEAMPLTIAEMQEAVDGIDVVNNQSKSVTPSELAQTVEPDTGYTGLESVSIGAIDSSYVGTAVPRRYSSDLTVNGRTVTAPAGYYVGGVSKSVSQMTLPTSASTTSSGTRKATISTSETTRYLNIPTGYNTSAAYYTISAVSQYNVGSAIRRYDGEVGEPTVVYDGYTPPAEDWTILTESSYVYVFFDEVIPPQPYYQAIMTFGDETIVCSASTILYSVEECYITTAESSSGIEGLHIVSYSPTPLANIRLAVTMYMEVTE